MLSDGASERQKGVGVCPFSHKTCPECEGVATLGLPCFPHKRTRASGRTKPLPRKHPSPFLMLWVLWAPLLSEILEVTINEAMWTNTAVHCAALGSDNTQNSNNVLMDTGTCGASPLLQVSAWGFCVGDGVLGHVCGLKSSGLQKRVFCVSLSESKVQESSLKARVWVDVYKAKRWRSSKIYKTLFCLLVDWHLAQFVCLSKQW